MNEVYSQCFKTPVGLFVVSATQKGLYSLDRLKSKSSSLAPSGTRRIPIPIRLILKRAVREICDYLDGQRIDFQDFRIDWTGYRPFEKRVLKHLMRIPWGKTATYQFLARRAGRPHVARYVGRILHQNRLPLVIPCHRIVPKSGGVGGFSKGIALKARLLKLERGVVDKPRKQRTVWAV